MEPNDGLLRVWPLLVHRKGTGITAMVISILFTQSKF